MTMIAGLSTHQHRTTGNDSAPTPGREPKYRELLNRLIRHVDDVMTLPELLAKRNCLSQQRGKSWQEITRGGDPNRGGRHGDKDMIREFAAIRS